MGTRLGFNDAWAVVRPRFGNLLGTLVLVALVLFALLLLGGILGILILPLIGAIVAAFYFLARWAVALPVSLLERHGVTGNLGRSTELTAGSRGAIVGVLILLFLILLVPAIVIGIPLSLASMPDIDPNATSVDPDAFRPPVGMQVAQWAVNGVIQLLGGFLGAALVTILYRRLLPPEPAPAPPATTEPAPVY